MDSSETRGEWFDAAQYVSKLPCTISRALNIEGQIYLLLEEKLQGVAETLGKVDEQGQIAEDFRAQVLGQSCGRLSYDRLY